MRYNYRILLGASAFCLALSFAQAEAIIGNAEEGAKKVPICAACHGQEGQGIAAVPIQPKLGGQHASYIRAQLYELKRSFSDKAHGLRIQNTMGPQASMLSDQDMANVAEYFNIQKPVYNDPAEDAKAMIAQTETDEQTAIDAAAVADAAAKTAADALASDKENKDLDKASKDAVRAARAAKSAVTKAANAKKDVLAKIEKDKLLVIRGEQLYNGGDLARHIPACTACHSPTGSGNGPAKYPKVAGQNYEYTFNQLHNFKNAERTNDPSRMMRDIAERMSDTEIEAVSTYIKYLKP